MTLRDILRSSGDLLTSTALVATCALLIAACGEADPSGSGRGAVQGTGRPDPAASTSQPPAASATTPGRTPDPADPVASADGGADAGDPRSNPPAPTPDPATCERDGTLCPTSACDGYSCPCDLLLQDCASPTDRCYPGGLTSGEGQCYGAGSRGRGQDCVEPPVNTPEACGRGLICLYESEEALSGTCLQLCGAGAPCGSGESCFSLDLGDGVASEWGVCAPTPPPPPAPPCDHLAQNCAEGQSCILSDQAYGNSCVEAGQRAEGQSCAGLDDCQPGLQCAGLAGSTPEAYYFGIHESYITRGGICLRYCPAGDDSACGTGQACAHISNIYDGSPRPDAGLCFRTR